jgi:hypothetical protein
MRSIDTKEDHACMAADQVVQIVASLCCLGPFVLVQAGRMRASSASYLWLNLAGSATLAVDAATSQDWGFLLLEGVWAVVSLVALVRTRRDIGAPDRDGASAL